MKKHAFGRTGFEVTQLGFGAAPAAYLAADQERAAKAINQLLDAGMNLIDTAAGYPGSESFLGERFSHRRKDFVLVSKCGHRIPESNSEPWAPETITATVDRALRQLRTDHVDVMLLHSCDMKVMQKGEALAALARAREAGKIRFAGYSGDNAVAAYAATLADIAVIETSVSIADQINIDLVLPKTVERNIGVLAKRPIANSAWRRELPGIYANYAKVYADRLATMKLDPAELGVSGPEETAWPELALRFTLSQKGVNTAIIGTTNPENASANIKYAEKGPLPAEVVEKIRKAFRTADPEKKWAGQT